MGELSAGSFVIGMFNALAFTGTSFVFRQLDNNGYQKEMRRHNLAVEKLAAAKEKWAENQSRQRARIAKLRRDLTDANVDMTATNKALVNVQKITHAGLTFTREPLIDDYYKPSTAMKDLTSVVSGVAGLGAGVIGAMVLL